MRITKAVMIACFALASGCVGGVTDPGPGDNTPTPDAPVTPIGKAGKQLYMNTVHSTVTAAKCSSPACHGQPNDTIYGFAEMDASAAYEKIVKLPTLVGTFTPASAAFLTKIDTTPEHYATTYSAADKAAITAWLAQEVMDRSDGSSPPPIDPIAKLREFSGCMKLADFTAANMIRWGQMAAANGQACKNCHAQGQASFITGNGTAGNAEQFFTTLTTQKDLLLKYFTVDATGKVVINTGSQTNAGVNIENHPRYDPTTNLGMAALQDFYMRAEAHRVAVPSTCDAPLLPL